MMGRGSGEGVGGCQAEGRDEGVWAWAGGGIGEAGVPTIQVPGEARFPANCQAH